MQGGRLRLRHRLELWISNWTEPHLCHQQPHLAGALLASSGDTLRRLPGSRFRSLVSAFHNRHQGTLGRADHVLDRAYGCLSSPVYEPQRRGCQPIQLPVRAAGQRRVPPSRFDPVCRNELVGLLFRDHAILASARELRRACGPLCVRQQSVRTRLWSWPPCAPRRTGRTDRADGRPVPPASASELRIPADHRAAPPRRMARECQTDIPTLPGRGARGAPETPEAATQCDGPTGPPRECLALEAEL